jgi:cytosine/adenosine deaminase-related metal-dependent hydrolase
LEYLNLYYAAHLQTGVNAFSLSDLRTMIQNTYRFMGDRFGVKLGKILPGYAADLLTIPYVAPTPMNAENALGHLFFGLFQSFRPNNVFVAGKQLLTNYALHPALESKLKNTSLEAKRLWDEIRKGDLDESLHHV